MTIMNNIISKYKMAAVMGLGLAFSLTSCDDLFEPAIENHLGFEYMYEHPDYADGILGNAYTRLPNGSYSFSDVATDDAVSNDATNTYRKMTAAGNWSSSNNPTEVWRNYRAAIHYINLYLANAEKVNWNKDETIKNMYLQRFMGEARGLRALFMYHLLRCHAGFDKDGNLLGVPNLLEPTTTDSDQSQYEVRASFADCMKQLIEDAKYAQQVLPLDYKDTQSDNNTVSFFGKTATVNKSTYNRVLGSDFAGRMSGRLAGAVLAQATLLGASDAFNSKSGVTWDDAANYAKSVIEANDGINGIDMDGLDWYCKTNIASLQAAACPKEVMWRTEKSESNTLEADNFPPSLYGNGRVNPTQNLVDAFPTATGYPITDSRSGYNAQNPYANRDPRLAMYIIYNGQPAGINSSAINTQSDNASNLDGLNKDVSKSTRTGYYMKKLLRQDVNLDPTVNSKQYHYVPRIRYTEMYLNFAEAANEAWGPKGGGELNAYGVIKKIRERAGITDLTYLDECASSKDKMRELIRNERRLELCFEGFRFWDLRRWKANLNEDAKGVDISASGFKYITVEKREYKENAYYGPIPYDQVLNFPTLIQNQGW